MTFHGSVELRPFRSGWQVQLLVECKDFEVIAVGAGRWTGAAVTGLAKVVCSLRSFRGASFRDRSRLRRDVPTYPMCKQPTRRIGIIYDQYQALGRRRNILHLQRRARITAIAGKL